MCVRDLELDYTPSSPISKQLGSGSLLGAMVTAVPADE